MSTELFLDRVYNIDGLELTGDEIKQRLISAYILERHFKAMKEDSE